MNIQSLTNAIEIWFLSQDNVQNMEKKASKGSIYRDELFLGLCLHPLSLLWFSNLIFLLLLTSWLWLGQNVVDDAWERMVSASGFSFFFLFIFKALPMDVVSFWFYVFLLSVQRSGTNVSKNGFHLPFRYNYPVSTLLLTENLSWSNGMVLLKSKVVINSKVLIFFFSVVMGEC